MRKFYSPIFVLIVLPLLVGISTFAQTKDKPFIVTKTSNGYITEVRKEGLQHPAQPGSKALNQAGTQIAPSLSAMSVAAVAVSCPGNISVNNTPGQCGAVVNYTSPTCIPTTFTQTSSSLVDVGGNQTGCIKRFFRAYNLPALGITQQFTLSSVDFGVALAGRGAPTVNIYQWNPSTTLAYANFTLVSSIIASIPNDQFYVFTQPISAVIPGGYAMIVEVVGDDPNFLLAGNLGSQTAPSYYSSACDATQTINQDFYSHVININGCGVVPVQTAGQASGTLFPVGTTTNTFEAGGSVVCSFDVTVNDTEVPNIACPANITVAPVSLNGTVVTYPTPTPTDNCPGVTVTRTSPASTASGSTFPIGTTTVSYRATDNAGLSTTCSFTVTVQNPACGKKLDKISVCHNGTTKCIDRASVQDHLNHGDYLGSCSPAAIASAASKVVISKSKAQADATASVYPNPTTGAFTVQLHNAKAGMGQVLMVDGKGAVVQRRQVTLLQGRQTLQMNLQGNTSGLYLVKVVDGKNTQVFKVYLQQ